MKTCDLMFCCLGNGLTVCDRNRTEGNDYKNVAHIANFGGVKLYDKTLPAEAREAITNAAKREIERFKEWFFQQDYDTQLFRLYYESLNMSQYLEASKAGTRDRSPEWLYQEYIRVNCLNHGYTMPA